MLIIFTACTSSSPHSYTLTAPIAQTGPQHILLGQPIDINSADESAFEALPGIGPVLAQRIVDDRMRHGSFQSVLDLKRVSGVGEKVFSRVSVYLVASKP